MYEDNRFGGYGAEVAAIVAEEAFDYLDGPVTRIAGPEVPGVPYNHVLEDWFMVNPEKIADGDPEARRVLSRRRSRPPGRPGSRRRSDLGWRHRRREVDGLAKRRPPTRLVGQVPGGG